MDKEFITVKLSKIEVDWILNKIHNRKRTKTRMVWELERKLLHALGHEQLHGSAPNG